MRRLLDWLTRTDDLIRLVDHYRHLCEVQNQMLAAKNRELINLQLENSRGIITLLQRFQDTTDDPALRDALQAGIDDMADQVARLEEHA